MKQQNIKKYQTFTEVAHIELAQQEAFQQEFLASMEIVPWN